MIISSSRSRNFDETKKLNIFFQKNVFFWQKSEGVILQDGNFNNIKSSPHPCLTFSGRMVFVSIFSSEKKELQVGKKIEKIQNNFALLYLLKQIQSKKCRRHFKPKT